MQTHEMIHITFTHTRTYMHHTCIHCLYHVYDTMTLPHDADKTYTTVTFVKLTTSPTQTAEN
jgi:hypothetical protein